MRLVFGSVQLGKLVQFTNPRKIHCNEEIWLVERQPEGGDEPRVPEAIVCPRSPITSHGHYRQMAIIPTQLILTDIQTAAASDAQHMFSQPRTPLVILLCRLTYVR